jgi:DNA (cytosine-5)-methyltransferase 1
MENVPGLVKGKMKLIFAEIMRELKASGYRVKCKKLNAMYFYVPQSRERLIFIGVRDDLGMKASYPKAESRPVTVGEALLNVSKNEINGKFLTLKGKTSKLIKQLKPGQRLEQLYEQINGKGNKAYFAFSRTHFNRPARTIAKDSAGLFHYDKDRTLTIGEYKRIASFPDHFYFNGTFSAVLARIGNSVPPLLMRSIAEHIRKYILINLPDQEGWGVICLSTY